MKLPFSAFLVRPPIEHGYSDAFSIKIVRVVDVDEKGRIAKCVYREGTRYVSSWELFDHLASRKDFALRGVSELLDKLYALAPTAAAIAKTPPSAYAPSPVAAPEANPVEASSSAG